MAAPDGAGHKDVAQNVSNMAPPSGPSEEHEAAGIPTQRLPAITANDTVLQNASLHNKLQENSIGVAEAESEVSDMSVTTILPSLPVDTTSGKTATPSKMADSTTTPLDSKSHRPTTTAKSLSSPAVNVRVVQLKSNNHTVNAETTTTRFYKAATQSITDEFRSKPSEPNNHNDIGVLRSTPKTEPLTKSIAITTSTATQTIPLLQPSSVTKSPRNLSNATKHSLSSRPRPSTPAGGSVVLEPSLRNTSTSDEAIVLQRPGESISNDTLVLVVVPIALTVFVLLGVLAVIFIVKKRRKHTGYRRTGGDEENSSNADGSVYGAVVKEKVETTVVAEPLYAKVDKSKKQRAIERVSVGEETVPLRDFAITANGACPVAALAELQQLSPLYADCTDDEDVFNKASDADSVDTDKNNIPASVTGAQEAQDLTVPGTGQPVDEVGPRASTSEAGLTLVECDIYDTMPIIDTADDEDDTYEIPESPSIVQARISRLLNMTPPLPPRPVSRTSIDLPIPQCDQRTTSDSDSDVDTDFEDWHVGSLSERAVGGRMKARCPSPPPVPAELPDSGTDSDAYLAPECHRHSAPGPNWKPFHEYDPVYVPHSDPAAMDKRVDNQNYVRGRPRSDSRSTNPYEEIAFNGIYATVDDYDVSEASSDEEETRTSRERKTPSPPPPPLVPRRRNRPISGVADMGRLSVHRATPPENAEPRYSGLIKQDIESEDDEPHEYTPLAYTKLMSQGEGPLLSEDDAASVDADTDSGNCTERRSSNDAVEADSSLHTLNGVVNGTESAKQNGMDGSGEGHKLFMKYADEVGALYNGVRAEDPCEESSSDSDDSYEPFDFTPTETADQ